MTLGPARRHAWKPDHQKLFVALVENLFHHVQLYINSYGYTARAALNATKEIRYWAEHSTLTPSGSLMICGLVGAAPTRSSARNKVKTSTSKAVETSNGAVQQKLDDYMDEDVKAEAGTKRSKDEAELEDVNDDDDDDGNSKLEPPSAGEDDGAEPATKKAKVSDDAKESGEDNSTTTVADLTREPTDGILERGHVYFFYRTKVEFSTDGTTPTSLDAVAKFHFLLLPRAAASSPSTTKKKQPFRFCVVGKKRLPDPSKGKREVFWSTVEKAGDDFAKEELGEAEDGLGERNYSTKTRGTSCVMITLRGVVKAGALTRLFYAPGA